MSTTTPSRTTPDVTARGEQDRGRGWRRVAIAAALIVALGDLVVQLLAGAVIPPLIGTAAVSLIAAGLAARWPRWGTWVLLVVAVAGVALAGQFALHGLGHPESTADFAHGLTAIAGRVVCAVAAVLALRGVAAGARAGGRALAVAGVALIALSVVLGITAGSDAAASGDVDLTAAGIAWTPDDLTVPAGGTLHVTNTDRIRHAVAVEGSPAVTELPAGTAQRVALDLAPGTYRLLCPVPGHEQMTATLTVTP